MASNKFKINHYNWFGQKLIAQHRYDEFLEVRHYLSTRRNVVCDHMNYLTGLALMKTRGMPFETLQRLDYQKNNQYLLLLCQCLLYFGNHDSVVAICKQVLNREINATWSHNPSGIGTGTEEGGQEANEGEVKESDETKRQDCLESACEESLEFRNIFDCVTGNRLINDPHLWFIFALCLELQGQLKDADLAYRVASKLASGQAKQLMLDGSQGPLSGISIAISNYNEPHIRYAEFCIRHRDDYKTAAQVLGQANSIYSSPVDYNLSPKLALVLCSQPHSNASLFSRAGEIIRALDNHSASTRNPSFIYNQIALRCKQKLSSIEPNEMILDDRTSDEKRLNLSFALVKSFILINDIIQNSSHEQMLFKSPLKTPPPSADRSKSDESIRRIHSLIDKAIETLRASDSSCWLSHSLWNNLGICYLMKRRYVASLSCFLKAFQLNPLDWRINYNIGLVYLHVNVTVRALGCSLAAKSFHHNATTIRHVSANLSHESNSSLINTMLASCYSGLGLRDEARRYYAEMVALSRKGSAVKAPVLALVNYLLLLNQTEETADLSPPSTMDDQDSKLISRLLDQLEQDWLQRNQNDSQFVPGHLEVARLVGTSQINVRPHTRQIYAWDKCQW